MAGPRPAPRRFRRRRFVLVGLLVAGVVGSLAMLGRSPGEASGDDVAASLPPITSAAPRIPGHEVYGFVPYWEIDRTIAAHLRRTDATTIALFSVTNRRSGELDRRQSGFEKVTGEIGRRIIADAHAAGRRVDVTWTSFGRDRNDRLFGDVTAQNKVIANLIALRADLGVDGLAVDVEGIADTDIPAYGAFIGRLRTALLEAAPRATVTAATGAGRQGAALGLAAALAGADRIFLMGYDYRTARSAPGGSAPLVRGDGDSRSLGWSVELYEAAGIPPERTVLGLPLYGLAWPAKGPAIGGAAAGAGDSWIPRRNLPAIENPKARATFDPVENVQFLAVPDGDAWQAIYYDTPQSLTPKLALANDHGLAGAGFWALGYERGLPDYTKLIAAFRAGRPMAASTP
jgi:spore germination protein YaaH